MITHAPALFWTLKTLQVEEALYGLEEIVLRYGIARAADVRSGRGPRVGSAQEAALADTPAAVESEITERVVRCGAACADFSSSGKGVGTRQALLSLRTARAKTWDGRSFVSTDHSSAVAYR